MKWVMTAMLAIGLLATGVLAQMPRQPGTEEERIGHFEGRWNNEVEVMPFPGWPSGKFQSSETCEWFAGGFQLVCHAEATIPWHAGVTSSQSIFAYNSRKKTYTYYRLSSLGEAYFWEGTVSDAVWTWTNESSVDGKLTTARMTVTEQSPTSYTSKMEFSTDGSPWTLLMETKATKVK